MSAGSAPLLCLLLLFGMECVATAEPVESFARAETPKPDVRVSVRKMSTGKQTLRVRYPWKAYTNPSVEVRLVTSEAGDRTDVRPLQFALNCFQGKVKVDIYDCLVKAASVAASKKFTEDQIEFEILARSSSLAKPAVCVVRRFAAKDPAPGAAAFFCLLRPWAKNDQELYLDLPKAHFARPGELTVWFLRGGDVLWEERLAWPGYRR